MNKSILYLMTIFILHCVLIENYSYATNKSSNSDALESSEIFIASNIYGKKKKLISLLKAHDIINGDNNWSGNTIRLIITGKLIDPDKPSNSVTRYLKTLQKQASESSGSVSIILSRQELNLLMGDFTEIKHVNTNAEAQILPSKLDKYFNKNHLSSYRSDESGISDNSLYTGFSKQLLEFIFDYSKYGEIGNWLAEQHLILQLNGNVFTYSGINYSLKNKSVKGIDRNFTKTLGSYRDIWQKRFDNNQLDYFLPPNKNILALSINTRPDSNRSTFASNRKLLISRKSSMNYTGNSFCHPLFEQDKFESITQYWDADRVWISNARYKQQMTVTRFNKQLLVLDYEKSNDGESEIWSAKVDVRGNIEIFFGDSLKPIEIPASPDRHISLPYEMSKAEVVQFMTQAIVTSKQVTKEGRTKPLKVTLNYQHREFNAVFKSVEQSKSTRHLSTPSTGDSYRFELAAHKLDELLGLGLVPATTGKTLFGKPGALQFWIDGLVSAIGLNERTIVYDGICSPAEQENMMNIFDYLVMNHDRNQSNILFTKSDWQIWLIDHTQAFGLSLKRPNFLKDVTLKLTPEFRKRLSRLSYEQIHELSPWLNSRQIDALWARRDKLLSGKM